MKTWTLEVNEKKRFDPFTGEPRIETDYFINDDKGLVALVSAFHTTPFTSSNLISAAPDMLEALKFVLKALDGEESQKQAIGKIDAAISKAQGELCK